MQEGQHMDNRNMMNAQAVQGVNQQPHLAPHPIHQQQPHQQQLQQQPLQQQPLQQQHQQPHQQPHPHHRCLVQFFIPTQKGTRKKNTVPHREGAMNTRIKIERICVCLFFVYEQQVNVLIITRNG